MNYAYLAKITLTDLKAYTFKACRCIRQTRFKFFGLDWIETWCLSFAVDSNSLSLVTNYTFSGHFLQ